MALTFSCNKLCSTCGYWQGVRKPSQGNRAVDVEHNAQGTCAMTNWSMRHYDCCNKWEMWQVLKK